MWAHPNYKPKWKPNEGYPDLRRTCIYPKCQETNKLISPNFDTVENIESNLGIKSRSDCPLLLCAKHYTALYRQLNMAQPCASCGVMPKQGTSFTRHCPDSLLINKIMRESSGDENVVCIQESDCVCNVCYRVHLAMLKSVEASEDDDGQLMHLIEIWKMKTK